MKSGNRVTLTYNLLLTGDTGAAAAETPAGDLAACLQSHFTTPVPLPCGGRDDPPTRLAYLLDHEYTTRGLSWSRLKGVDAARAALLRAAAERADCEITLALTEIQETWEAYYLGEEDPNDHEDPDGGDDGEYSLHNLISATIADDGERLLHYLIESATSADEGEYLLQDLIESSTTLAHWISPETGRLEEISLDLSDAEVASTTPTADLTPGSSHYEGYMGNCGNTLDRWYQRAALVIWPRGQASPAVPTHPRTE